MFQLKLLRRPLPPKVETERLLPKKKRYKDVTEEDKESQKILETDDAQAAASDKSQPIFLCFPDYDFGIQIPKRNFMIPLQHSGPPSFPEQKRRRPFRLRIPAPRELSLHLGSDFMLKGMPVVDSLHFQSLPTQVRKPVLSRCNYEVLTSQLIAEERRGPTEVSTIILSWEDTPYVEQRKPARQVLIASTGQRIKDNRLANSRLEKMLEEKSFLHEEEQSFAGEEGEEKSFTAERDKGFPVKEQKKKRVTYAETEYALGFAASFVSGVACKPQTRVADEETQLKTKAETAIFVCSTHRKTGLSLKVLQLFSGSCALELSANSTKLLQQIEAGVALAYFLSQLPDLSPLADFLLYLNLSFNCLCSFPKEVFCLKHLEVLKLRNNSIKFIPEEIGQMKSLKYLVASFNLLTSLPAGLFTLPNLEGLDVSYNELETIPNDIGNFSTLTYLNVEGNLLYVLPCGVLKLDLTRLKVENNFLHPYFWNEICQLEPQRLTDMAAHCFAEHKLWEKYHDIPKDIQEILCNFRVCDCCPGPLYGKGLRFFCAYKSLYGLRLPYLFCSCSPACYRAFIATAASE